MYNCQGCTKEDPDFTGQVEDCDECLGSGIDNTEVETQDE